VNVNTTDATTGATALLLPAQNTHTLHDPIRDTERVRALAALRSLSILDITESVVSKSISTTDYDLQLCTVDLDVA